MQTHESMDKHIKHIYTNTLYSKLLQGPAHKHMHRLTNAGRHKTKANYTER